MPPLTQSDLVSDLHKLGLKAGMRVMVHSSLKSLGPLAAGPQTIVEALMEVITPQGLLLFPSFNHGKPFEPGEAGYYSAQETPTTNGAIPEYFRRRSDVLRSLDPTHAFAAWGIEARRFLKDHHRTQTMGPESPLGRLWRGGGHCLLLGVNYGPNTFKHVVEMTRQAPCLGIRTEAYPVKLRDGRVVSGRTWGWRAGTCPISEAAQPLQSLMCQKKLETRGTVGAAETILFKYDDCFKVLSELFEQGWGQFPPCARCQIKPRHNEFTVDSDWDFSKHQLRADSAAWTYEDGL